jgi:hypothetical protein
VLLVLASHPYDDKDYLRTYDAFCAEARVTPKRDA